MPISYVVYAEKNQPRPSILVKIMDKEAVINTTQNHTGNSIKVLVKVSPCFDMQ
jgi:hypothetical protein